MKSTTIEVRLNPDAAPGCKYAGGMEISAVQLGMTCPMRTSVDGMEVRLESRAADLDPALVVKAEVAMPAAREMLVALYLDYRNNYLSPKGYADAHGLYLHEAEELIKLARAVADHDHPER